MGFILITALPAKSDNDVMFCLQSYKGSHADCLKVKWSPAGKGLTSWLSFVVSNCEFVTFPLVSWVRCGT